MPYRGRIPGCFREMDKIFAGDALDIERAGTMLRDALVETSAWSDVEEAMTEYLERQGCSEEHIRRQLNRARDIRSYFKND